MPAKRLSSVIAQEAVTAVKNAGGNISAAARDLGIPRGTLSARLRTAASTKVSDEKSDKIAAENAHLRKLLDLAKKRISTKPAWKVARVRRYKRPGKDDFIRWIMPDSHGMYIDKPAFHAALKDLKALGPDEVVFLGDHVDCEGFMAEHHVQHYGGERKYSYEEDIGAANWMLDCVQSAAPRAAFHYLEGNHESHVERWILGHHLATAKDVDFLRRLVAPEYLLRLAERGIPYYRRSVQYNGISTPGVIKLGKCYFTHEAGASGSTAARKHVNAFAASVVFGHTHRAQGEVVRKVATEEIGSWSPGCLSQLVRLYNHSHPVEWTHGYAVQVVSRSGLFQHLNITISNGESCAGPLIARLAA